MDVQLPEELQQIRDTLRRFTERELEPWAKVIDERGEIPSEVIDLLRDNGYLGLRIGEEFGGAGMGIVPFCLTVEEFSRSHRVFTLLLDATSGLAPIAVERLGTPEQKERYLRDLAQGRKRAAFGLTEPDAGSDAAAIRTRAVKDGDDWVINGRKHWISGGSDADVVMVMAVTDPEKRARGGITCLLVERGTPGFEVTRVDTTIGSEAIKLAELTFEDCRVPASAVLGEVGQGFQTAMQSLTDGRLAVSSACIGTADRLIELSTQHASQRTTFGDLLINRQAIQWMLADSAVELMAARAMVYETLRQVEAGLNPRVTPAMCKLFCSEMVGRVADRAVQIHGGMGLVRGFSIERFYRDIRHYRVGEGSSEVQRMTIARELAKRYQA